MKTITLDSRICLRHDLQTMDIDDATFVATDNGGYGVELIARRIWQLLPRAPLVADLCELLLKEYDVDRERCEREVLEFLTDSARAGLIEKFDPDRAIQSAD
jgi:hypothetical protein